MTPALLTVALRHPFLTILACALFVALVEAPH